MLEEKQESGVELFRLPVKWTIEDAEVKRGMLFNQDSPASLRHWFLRHDDSKGVFWTYLLADPASGAEFHKSGHYSPVCRRLSRTSFISRVGHKYPLRAHIKALAAVLRTSTFGVIPLYLYHKITIHLLALEFRFYHAMLLLPEGMPLGTSHSQSTATGLLCIFQK